jgi:hypothetical protein
VFLRPMPWTDAPAILLAGKEIDTTIKGVSMYHYNDFEAWQGHRDELLREAEQRRLARQLLAERSGENALQIRRLLTRLVTGLLPQNRKIAGC